MEEGKGRARDSARATTAPAYSALASKVALTGAQGILRELLKGQHRHATLLGSPLLPDPWVWGSCAPSLGTGPWAPSGLKCSLGHLGGQQALIREEGKWPMGWRNMVRQQVLCPSPTRRPQWLPPTCKPRLQGGPGRMSPAPTPSEGKSRQLLLACVPCQCRPVGDCSTVARVQECVLLVCSSSGSQETVVPAKAVDL